MPKAGDWSGYSARRYSDSEMDSRNSGFVNHNALDSIAKISRGGVGASDCPMKLCRFATSEGQVRIGLMRDGVTVVDLTAAGVDRLETVLEQLDPRRFLERISANTITAHLLAKVKLLAPIGRQEVWAAGVTYQRSKTARMEESDFSATAYDKVYDAARPEIFFKSLAEKEIGRAHV